MEKLKDQLSWEEFKKHSEGRKTVPNKISEFNRLVAHSENFFIISGYGAFTKGYLLIISKDFIPSFGLMNKEKYEELLAEKQELLKEKRRKMLDAAGFSTNIFEGTEPIPKAGNPSSPPQAGALAGVDPNDEGVDLNGIMAIAGRNWRDMI